MTMTKPTEGAPTGNGFSGNPLALYQGLERLDTAAICYLHHKTCRHLEAKKHLAKASAEDAEEMANDAVLLALQKILDRTYVFQGFSPLTFSLVIADNLLRNFSRKKRLDCRALEEQELPVEAEIEAYLTQKELELKLKKGMDALGDPCRLLIRLKYFDNLKDEEIVGRKLTPYNTADSLKTKRCNCMRKLGEALKKQ